jgi:hypothetical protein
MLQRIVNAIRRMLAVVIPSLGPGPKKPPQ